MDDRELVSRLLDGDETAFNFLWEQYYPRILRFILNLVGYNQDQAEDITQDVFVHCLQNLDQFQFKSKLTTWLMKIGYYMALKARDRTKRQGSFYIETPEGECDLTDFIPSGDLSPHEIAARNEAMTIYRRALLQISETERTAWVLHHEQGLPYEEIAKIMDNTPNALRISVSRAKQKLCDLMGAEYLASDLLG